ncbi:MAG: glycosyl hydrolase [Flavobacteriales bacterium]|nr:glycosyl hydrolase [Flavobacteriales bacterium]
MRKTLELTALLFGVCLTLTTHAQKKGQLPAPTAGTNRLHNAEMREALEDQSLINGIPFRSVGPTVMSGRVVDISVNPEDPTHFLVAYASGGLWITRNNGTSFEPLFDSEITLTIGAIHADWSTGSIWIGTGENNSSRSSYSGTGMYHSNDWGTTWSHRGLEESHHIGEIKVHPGDLNTIWVGVLGHLYSPNAERGVYKSTDGGNTWSRVLFEHENAGVIDLEIDPLNPDHLFASTWDRTRRAWDFREGGEGSKIFESTDGGATWNCITCNNSGFPHDAQTGRIGTTVATQDGQLFLYAILDNQNFKEEEPDESDKLKKQDFQNMTPEAFREVSNVRLQEFLDNNGFPERYDSTYVREHIENGDLTPTSLFEYLTDANASLFDRPVIGAEVYAYNLSTGKWSRTHEDNLDDVVYSYGYYFGLIESHPNDPNRLYIAGVPVLTSADGGATWSSISEDNVHADHHSIWVDPLREGHLILGNDGGINISYDNGSTYVKCNSPAVGQFYTVNVDNAQPYNIYGGLQDNGVWKGPSTYEHSYGWYQSGRYPYQELMGGDGMKVQIDNRDNNIVYTGYQFGHYYRINLASDDYRYFHPSHELGERPLRWNWQTPVLLSPHNNDIVYMASNRFHRSMDAAETWETLSEDLTSGGKPGDVPYGTITCIEESPLQFGMIYCGTDDGHIHISTDVGVTWTEITGKLPHSLWVSRIVASTHEKDRLYVTLNGYRYDDFTPYIYVSEDRGKTWNKLGQQLPLDPVNVIEEDSENADILYVGTDGGLYVSLDRGATFMDFNATLPPVAVHDLVIQERENDLVIGTHGRSIYIANVEDLRRAAVEKDDLAVYAISPISHSESWGEGSWSKWLGFREPSIDIPLFSRTGHSANVELLSDSGVVLTAWEADSLSKGINYIPYDLTLEGGQLQSLTQSENPPVAKANGKHYLPPGTYTIRITAEGITEETQLIIE